MHLIIMRMKKGKQSAAINQQHQYENGSVNVWRNGERKWRKKSQ